VLQQVVAPNVDQERHVRSDGGDVREVLVRSDADIGAAGGADPLERSDDMEIRVLVGNEVVGVEEAGSLG
jgi:hypothetical protein